MLTQEHFYGGAMHYSTAAHLTLNWRSPRVIRVTSASARDVTLPNTEGGMPPIRVGALRFIIINDGAANVSIKYNTPGSVTLATLTTGQAALVSLLSTSPEKWHRVIRTVGGASAVGKGARAAIENPAEAQTYDPYCFEGELCDLAISLGVEPLDGTDDKDLVLAAMFQDPDEMQNSSREPIRAADFTMPSIVVVQFQEDEFTHDATHPGNGTYGGLSEEFFTALNGSNRMHALEYDGTAHGVSRHWHHARFTGLGPPGWTWGGADINVQRWVWKKEIPYGPAEDPERYTLEIRFVMEQTVEVPDEELDCDDPGTTENDPDVGSWGALFNIYVFTDEVYPDFDDGETYTPAGGGAAVAFTRDDPAAWGIAQGVSGGTSADKFVHPQCVICACLPTTFEAPVGVNYIPHLDRERTPGGNYRGHNLEYCYTVGNGSPWCTVNNSPNAIASGYGIAGNVVFGSTVGGLNHAGMTRGGNFPISRPTEYVTIENGNGTGMTYLKPTRAGWDDEEGVLTVAVGSSMACAIACVPLDCKPDGCRGHPNEPFEGIGGSHNCFNNNGEPEGTKCCVSTTTGNVGATEKCQRTTVKYGDIDGPSSCTVISVECETTAGYTTSYSMPLEDYDYNMAGGQNLRTISWLRLEDDPEKDLREYDYVSTSVGDLHQDIGSWTFNAAYIEPAGVAGSTAVRSLVTYEEAVDNWDWWGVSHSVTTKKAKLGTHGIGFGREDVSNEYEGYGAYTSNVDPTHTRLRLAKYSNGVETVFPDCDVTIESSATDIEIEYDQHGADISVTFTPTDADPVTLTARDCEFVDGSLRPCLFSKDTSVGNVRFDDDWSINDLVREFVEITASLGQESVGVTIDEKALKGYGKCDDTHNPECGTCCTPVNCNCTEWGEGLVRIATASHSGGDIVPINGDCGTNTASNPTYIGGPNPGSPCCEGPWCPPNTELCGDCPAPFSALRFSVPSSCRPDEDEGTRPRLCGGISAWYWTQNVCE